MCLLATVSELLVCSVFCGCPVETAHRMSRGVTLVCAATDSCASSTMGVLNDSAADIAFVAPGVVSVS